MQEDVNSCQMAIGLLHRNYTASCLAQYASWCALLLHAFCFWEGMPKPSSDRRLQGLPTHQLLGTPVVPSLMHPIQVARIQKQTKPFTERLMIKMLSLGSNQNDVGPDLQVCGNLWKSFTFMHRKNLGDM